MNRFFIMFSMMAFIICFILVSTRSVAAIDTNAAPSETAVKDSVAIDANKELRDPFWPIGYRKKRVDTKLETKPEVTIDEWDKARSLIRVGGMLKMGKKYYATINGMMVKAGDVIAIEIDKKKFKFIIHSINMNGVKFKKIER